MELEINNLKYDDGYGNDDCNAMVEFDVNSLYKSVIIQEVDCQWIGNNGVELGSQVCKFEHLPMEVQKQVFDAVYRAMTCTSCNGTGWVPLPDGPDDSIPENCPKCGG